MIRTDFGLGALASYYQSSSRTQKVLFATGSVLFGVMVFHLAALLITRGPLSGPVSLRKPATFAETGWLLCWSVGWLLSQLKMRLWEKVFITAGTLLFGVGETLIAAIQAWRGVPFHYNTIGAFSTNIFILAGIDAVLFLVSAALLLVVSLRRQTLAPSLLLAVRLGATILLIGIFLGFMMIANWSAIWQGWPLGTFRPGFDTDRSNFSEGVSGGNLIAIHAIGVHGLSLLLLPAWLLTLSRSSERQRVRLIACTGGVVLGTLVVLGLEALALKPLNHLSLWAEVFLGAALIGFLWISLVVGQAILWKRAV